RLCAETGWLWSRSAVYLRDVDSGRDHSLSALPMVYGISQPASGLDVAKLLVKRSFNLSDWHESVAGCRVSTKAERRTIFIVMMTNTTSAFHNIVAQLNDLTERLNAATTADDRRTLLRQYRTLLEQADQATCVGEEVN